MRFKKLRNHQALCLKCPKEWNHGEKKKRIVDGPQRLELASTFSHLTLDTQWWLMPPVWRLTDTTAVQPDLRPKHTHVTFVIKQAADTQTHVCFKISMVGQKQCVFTHLLNKQYSQIHVSMCMCVYVGYRAVAGWLEVESGGEAGAASGLDTSTCAKWTRKCMVIRVVFSFYGGCRQIDFCMCCVGGCVFCASWRWMGDRLPTACSRLANRVRPRLTVFGEIWTVDHVEDGQKQSYRFPLQEEWQQPEADWCTGLKGAFVRLFTPPDAQTRNPKLNMNFNQIEIWNPNESTTINWPKQKCSNLITITLISFPNCCDWNFLWCRRLAQNYCL